MKRVLTVFIVFLMMQNSFAQSKPKEDKAPTQKEMEDMMKEAQKMMEEMSPEDKKMMDSLGIKIPNMNSVGKNIPKVTDAQLKEAYENENRIVPKRDATRIATIISKLSDIKMSSYISSLHTKLKAKVEPSTLAMGDKVYTYIKSQNKNSAEEGNMATSFWMIGQPEIALYVLGKLNIKAPENTDNINNYAAMLTMQGGQHLAIPILNNLNQKFPKNSTILNNLGQAWFGLGELNKAEKYLDSTIRIYAYHPQANLAKAAIEESRGNIEKAREAVKKSIQHSYTKEKEEKLNKLGQQLDSENFKMPQKPKNDPMNLGGFRAPSFPMSVDACIKSEVEWEEFFNQLDNKITFLNSQRKSLFKTAEKAQNQRQNADITLVKDNIINPGFGGQFVSVPMYAERASKKLNDYLYDQYADKLKRYMGKVTSFITGDGLVMKTDYEKDMQALLDKYETNADIYDLCPDKKKLTDAYLGKVNRSFHQLYLEALQLQKEVLNETAYWNLFIQWPEMYEVTKIDLQLEWLKALKQGLGGLGYASGFPFVSITSYECKKEDPNYELGELAHFDDVACKYKSELNLIFGKIRSNCSRMYTELNVPFLNVTRFDDFERAEGDSYVSSTVKISAEVGKSVSKGPLKAEAKVGVGVEFEMDRSGLKDVTIIAEAKVGVGTDVINGTVEQIGSATGVNVQDITVGAGMEGRISIMSGQVSGGPTGIFETIMN